MLLIILTIILNKEIPIHNKHWLDGSQVPVPFHSFWKTYGFACIILLQNVEIIFPHLFVTQWKELVIELCEASRQVELSTAVIQASPELQKCALSSWTHKHTMVLFYHYTEMDYKIAAGSNINTRSPNSFILSMWHLSSWTNIFHVPSKWLQREG